MKITVFFIILVIFVSSFFLVNTKMSNADELCYVKGRVWEWEYYAPGKRRKIYLPNILITAIDDNNDTYSTYTDNNGRYGPMQIGGTNDSPWQVKCYFSAVTQTKNISHPANFSGSPQTATVNFEYDAPPEN